MIPDSNDIPRGLYFFRRGTSTLFRRRRIMFVAFLLLAALAFVWPIYPIFSGIFPLILGLPLSFAWVVLWLALVFIGMILLYRFDASQLRTNSSDEPSQTN